MINASAAVTVDSTSIVYVGYTNDSGNFIGEVGINTNKFYFVVVPTLTYLNMSRQFNLTVS